MPDTGVGCTSWRGLLLRLASAAASKAAFAACPGPLPMAESNDGGLMAPAFWSRELGARSGCDSDSCAVEGARLLDFLDSWSRGSSWHRCPMLRLMHLVQGLSCSQHTTAGQRPPAHRTNNRKNVGWGRATYEITRHVLSSRTWLATRTTRVGASCCRIRRSGRLVCRCRALSAVAARSSPPAGWRGGHAGQGWVYAGALGPK
jgi:hypothetical protein